MNSHDTHIECALVSERSARNIMDASDRASLDISALVTQQGILYTLLALDATFDRIADVLDDVTAAGRIHARVENV